MKYVKDKFDLLVTDFIVTNIIFRSKAPQKYHFLILLVFISFDLDKFSHKFLQKLVTHFLKESVNNFMRPI